MDEPKQPKPLNAGALATQQRKENQSTARFNAGLNRLDQTDQFGNTLAFEGTNGPVTQSLGELGQQYTSGLSGLGGQYFDMAGQGLPSSQGAFDNAYSTATANITPRFDRSRDALDNRLRNQGLDPSSEAYKNAMGDLSLQQNEALNDLTTKLHGQVFNQGLAARQQQVGELSPGLQFGNQVLNPSYVSVPQVGTNPVDVAGLNALQHSQAMQNYQNDLNRNNAMLGGLAGLGGTLLQAPLTGGGSLIGGLAGF